MSSTDTSGAVPKGIGYATMKVNSKDAVVMAGKLADGESFSTTGYLVSGSAGNQYFINKALTYPSATPGGTKGSLVGTLTFVPETGTSDLSGTMEWIKPPQSRGAYQQPIDTTLNVVGSLYTYARGDSVLPGFPVEGSTTSGTFTLSDTNGLVFSGSSQLTATNKLTVTNPPNHLRVSITPSTGVFKGSFEYPAVAGGRAKPASFGGVLFQDQIKGGGFFLGPFGSGTVSLSQ